MLRLFLNKLPLEDERYRKALLTTVMNVIAQVVQLVTGLISVPLALHYVGTERFGIWMTISTALTFITFSDFGVGIGLQDRMTVALAEKNFSLARRLFLTVLSFVSVLAVSVYIAGHFFVSSINFVSLFSLKSPEAIREIVPTVEMVIIVFGLGLLAGIVQRAFNALQEGFWIALIQIGARICSLILLFVVVKKQMGLPALAFVVSGVSAVGVLIFGIVILTVRHFWMVPDLKGFREFCDLNSLRAVLNIGVMGLGATIAVYFINNSTPFLMSTKYGAEKVSDYVVMLRVIGIPTLLLTYMLLPLWPAITEAKAKKDANWIRSAYRKYGFFTLGLSLVSTVVLLTLGKSMIRLWTGNEAVVPSMHLLVAGAAFMVVGYWNALISVVLNGLSMFKGQATYGLCLAIGFSFVAYLVPNTWGKEWVIWAVLFGYLLRCIAMQIELSLYLKKYYSPTSTELNTLDFAPLG